MKRIPLTQGQFAIVDDEDYAAVSAFKWCAANPRGAFYALRNGGRLGRIQMHRFITQARDGMVVDHINHDTLDNRRSNLRVCTQSQNMMNRLGPQKNSTTGILGVSWDKVNGKFRAQIKKDRRAKFLGRFETKEEAKMACLAAREILFGEFSGGI